MSASRNNQVNLRLDDDELKELRAKWTKWIRSKTGNLASVNEISLSAYIRQLIEKDKP